MTHVFIIFVGVESLQRNIWILNHHIFLRDTDVNDKIDSLNPSMSINMWDVSEMWKADLISFNDFWYKIVMNMVPSQRRGHLVKFTNAKLTLTDAESSSVYKRLIFITRSL